MVLVISDRSHLQQQQQAHDPYALPSSKNLGGEASRVVLSQDPMIRVMIDDSADVDFETLVRNVESERSSLESSSIRSPPQLFSPTSKVSPIFGVWRPAGRRPYTLSIAFSRIPHGKPVAVVVIPLLFESHILLFFFVVVGLPI